MAIKFLLLVLVLVHGALAQGISSSVVSQACIYKFVPTDVPPPPYIMDSPFLSIPKHDYVVLPEYGIVKIDGLKCSSDGDNTIKFPVIGSYRFDYAVYSVKTDLFFLSSHDTIYSHKLDDNKTNFLNRLMTTFTKNPVIIKKKDVEYYFVTVYEVVNSESNKQTSSMIGYYFDTSSSSISDPTPTVSFTKVPLSANKPYSLVVGAMPKDGVDTAAFAFYSVKSTTLETYVYLIQPSDDLKTWDQQWIKIENFYASKIVYSNDILILYGGVLGDSEDGNAQVPIKVAIFNTAAKKECTVVCCGKCSDSSSGFCSKDKDQGDYNDFFRWTEFNIVSNSLNKLGAGGIDYENMQIFIAHGDASGYNVIRRINLFDTSLEIPYMITGTSYALSTNFLIKYDPPSTTGGSSPSATDGSESKVKQTIFYVCTYLGNIYIYYPPAPCPNMCSNHGKCIKGQCVCDAMYSDVDCSSKKCAYECKNGGTCSKSGICECTKDWSESDCSVRRCSNDCNMQGTCTGPPDYKCVCDPKHGGPTCSEMASNVCDTFSEGECVSKVGSCGWCQSKSACMKGSYDGPSIGSCPAWFVGAEYQVGVVVGASILIAIWSLMLLNNLVSSISIDYATAIVLGNSEKLLTASFLKEFYWRDERSSKFWKLTEQLQFISSYVILAVSFPSELIQFCSFFNWVNFFLPMPYGFQDNTTAYPNRVPSSIDQYFNSAGVNSISVLYGTAFWFGCFLVACSMIYALYGLISWLCLKSREPKIAVVLVSKFYYVLTRVTLWGIYPLIVASAWHMRAGYGDNQPSIALAVLIFIIFGLLPIAFNAFIVWGKGKTLLLLYLQLRFGPLYSIYHYKKAFFNCIVLARRVLLGLFLGVLAVRMDSNSIYWQAIVLIFVWVAYGVSVVILRPYLDMLHMISDLIITVLSMVAIGVSMLHKNSPSFIGEIIAAVCVSLQIVVCIVGYIHSWTNIKGGNTLPTIFLRHSVNVDVDPTDSVKMTEGQRERAERTRKGDVSGALPQTKKRMESEDSDVDSSLQSS